jgi:hypothetical protein
MKSYLKIALSLAVLSMAQQASAAAYTVRITGSTAFRGATHRAIVAMLGGDSAVKMAHTGSAATQSAMEGAAYASFLGTYSATGDTYTIQCSWSGSVEGIAHLSGNNAATYGTLSFAKASLIPSTAGVANAALLALDANKIIVTASAETGTANLAMSDVQQQNTAYFAPGLPTPVQVGVIPFCWIANRGTTGVTGVTAQLATQLLANGFLPKSMFTGAVADDPIVTPSTGTYVFATGRNSLSGTRLTALLETKYGAFQPVQQYKITNSGTTMVSVQLWPTSPTSDATVDPLNAGNGGYTSGGTLAGVLGATSTSGVTVRDQTGADAFGSTVGLTVIGYASAADTNTATNGTNQGVRLSYEGFTYTDSTQNVVQNGQYTFWGYENLYTRSSGLSTGDTTVATQLQSQMGNSSILGTTGVTIGSMNVNRQSDGTVVGHN